MRIERTINMLSILGATFLLVSIFARLYCAPTTLRGDMQALYLWDAFQDDAGSAGLRG